jgi:hypothetical protein
LAWENGSAMGLGLVCGLAHGAELSRDESRLYGGLAIAPMGAYLALGQKI